MRLVRLSVQRFQCIERAELDFGPHLNVLYGPNDLGKSSLAWAIRAVLLLQHNQAQHARFVSWYGGGEPQVELTFCDDDERYWRVKKIFGTSSGQSSLESSKDGRAFVAEASGREVDKRLRELLRWGLPTPGGRGPQGMSDSFLTQVLLAEQAQESVRKVLFDASLEGDDEPSGRARLTQALGALAQDPVFKKVLDQAQPFVDRAYTATGRKKKSAGSPFLETADKIKDLLRERDELDAKVKDSAQVEARIVALHGERDEVVARVATAEEALARGRHRLEARRRREALGSEHAGLQARAREVETLGQRVDVATANLAALRAGVDGAVGAAAEAARVATAADAAWAQARAGLDAATHDDAEGVAREAGLRAAVAAAEDARRAAGQRLAAAKAALKAATEAARRVAEAAAAVDGARRAQVAADDVAAGAEAAAIQARARRADADERVRELRSGDRAQARELARKELEHRLLALTHRQAEVEDGLRRAEEVGALTAAAELAARQVVVAEDEQARARRALASAEETLRTLAAGRTELALLEVYARCGDARDQLASATAAASQAASLRARAQTLREQARTLAGAPRPEPPPLATIRGLRALREDLRAAEAALGGGLSLVIRPRRRLELQVAQDGGPATVRATTSPVTVAASRAISVQIDDLVDIEVTAGEVRARQAAVALRARWLHDGEAVLTAHGVASIDELEELRAQVDTTATQAAALGHLAEEAERNAAQLPVTDVEAARTALAALERELGDADRAALARRQATLGQPWHAALRHQQAEVERTMEASRGRLEQARARMAQLETQREVHAREVGRLDGEVARLQATLAEPWASAVASHRVERARLADERRLLDAQLHATVSGASQEEATAAAALEDAGRAAASAEELAGRRKAAAAAARDAMIQAATQLDACRRAAREVEGAPAWTAALEAGGAHALDPWTGALRDAEVADAGAERARAEAVRGLAEAVAARDAAIQGLRAALQRVEAQARAARTAGEAAATEHRRRADEHAAAQHALGELRLAVAGANLAELRRAIDDVAERLAGLPADDGGGAIDDDAVAALEHDLARHLARRGELDEEVAKARGALEQVGGAIVRERLLELDQAIERAKDREREIEVEYAAWQLLVTTLRETESTESAHLGRALAGPVSERFRALTGGRYGELELGTHLEAAGVHVAGELREIGALSAGTQDQLATLLRLCIAEQLRSSIVLDDHLSQSDAGRVAWFTQVLRDASAQVQIVLITCRPREVLDDAELAAAAAGTPPAPSARVHALDLSTIIRRFAPAARAAAGAPGDGGPGDTP